MDSVPSPQSSKVYIMDLDLLFGNPISVIVLIFSFLLIVGALFSKWVRKYSEKIEEKKRSGYPCYAKQKDILSAYCPSCEKKLTSKEMKSKICETCDKGFKLNPAFVTYSSIGCILIFLLPVAGLSKFFAEYETTFNVLYFVALASLFYGLSKNKYRCVD